VLIPPRSGIIGESDVVPEAGLEWSSREAIWSVIHELLQDPDTPVDADPKIEIL
jgi:hypothetical protein